MASGFTQKSSAHLFAVDAQKLECDQTVDGGVEGEVECSHPALSEVLPDLVATDH